MMYPEGPQVYTQGFPERFGGGGGGGADFVRLSPTPPKLLDIS